MTGTPSLHFAKFYWKSPMKLQKKVRRMCASGAAALDPPMKFSWTLSWHGPLPKKWYNRTTECIKTFEIFQRKTKIVADWAHDVVIVYLIFKKCNVTFTWVDNSWKRKQISRIFSLRLWQAVHIFLSASAGVTVCELNCHSTPFGRSVMLASPVIAQVDSWSPWLFAPKIEFTRGCK